MLRSIKTAAVLLVLLVGSACHKKLPPAPPTPLVPPTPAAAPSTAAQAPGTAAQAPSTAAQAPSVGSQPVRQPKKTTPQATAPQPTAPQPAAAAPEFRLGQALTPEEARANNAEIDRHIEHVTQALATIGNRQLSADQKSTVTQIRGFIAQAQQMRTPDVVRARSLAERADILTQDLMSTMK